MVWTYEEIGNKLFKVIDMVMGAGSSTGELGRSSLSSKYQWRLVRETDPTRRAYWDLIDSMLSHPTVGHSASVGSAAQIVTCILSINDRSRAVRGQSPEEAGKMVIEDLLSTTEDWLVALPVSGILPHRHLYTLGNVAFGVYQRILEHYGVGAESFCGEDTEHAAELRHIARVMKEYESERLENWLCAGCVVSACDSAAAYALAEGRINTAINIIRLTLPVHYRITARPSLSVESAYLHTGRISIRVTDGWRNIPSNGGTDGFPMVFPHVNDEFGVMPSVERAGAIAARPPRDRTKLEQVLLTAVTWAGEGIDSLDLEMKVVKCMVALEVLFMLRHGKKQESIVEGAVKLFLPVSSERNVGDHAKRVYALRSAIVHGGERLVSEEDAEWAERLASGCILKALEHLDRWRDARDFLAWLKGGNCLFPM